MSVMTRHQPAVLLVGGMGTRLRSVVPSAPKPLASVGDQSFLELLVRQLRHQGIRRLVMCSGYLADQIEEQIRRWQRMGVSPLSTPGETAVGHRGAL